MRATVSACTTGVPGRNARTTHAVATNLSCRAAVCASVTGTIATAVPRAADRSGGCTGALVTKPFVLGSITSAFACRWRIGSKHLLAPLGAIPISTEGAANAAQTEKATDGGGDDRSQRMAARSRTGQCFGQLIKVLRLHFCRAAPPGRDCEESAQVVKIFLKQFE